MYICIQSTLEERGVPCGFARGGRTGVLILEVWFELGLEEGYIHIHTYRFKDISLCGFYP